MVGQAPIISSVVENIPSFVLAAIFEGVMTSFTLFQNIYLLPLSLLIVGEVDSIHDSFSFGTVLSITTFNH